MYELVAIPSKAVGQARRSRGLGARLMATFKNQTMGNLGGSNYNRNWGTGITKTKERGRGREVTFAMGS